MKTNKLISTLLIVTAAYSVSSYAHNPKEHAKEKEAPNCESMQDMDKGKMDKNDPVMMAMMKKCHKMADKNSDKHMEDMEDMEKDDNHQDKH